MARHARELRLSRVAPRRLVEQLEDRPGPAVLQEDLLTTPDLSRHAHLARPGADPVEKMRRELGPRELRDLAVHGHRDHGHRLVNSGLEGEREFWLRAGLPQCARGTRRAVEEIQER